jgi:hypothetical protein
VSNPRGPDIEAGGLYFSGEKIAFSELGMEVLRVEPGTAYHIPEAVFAVSGAGAEEFGQHWQDPVIPCDRVKFELLRLLGE